MINYAEGVKVQSPGLPSEVRLPWVTAVKKHTLKGLYKHWEITEVNVFFRGRTMSEKIVPKIVISVISGSNEGKKYTFQKERISIGRSADNDIPLSSDSAISSNHAELIWGSNKWHIEDNNSKNGTYIEWMESRFEVNGAMAINFGQRFILGETILSFEEARPHEEEITQVDDALDTSEKIILRIDLEEDQLKYQFFSDSAYGTRYTVPFNKSDIRNINLRLNRMVSIANTSSNLEKIHRDATNCEIVDVLEQVGTFMSEHVFPPRILAKLSESKAGMLFLIHHPALTTIPWELAMVEGQFMCRRFGLGRQLMVEDFESRRFTRKTQGNTRVLIISNPTGDLIVAQQEAEKLLKLLTAKSSNVEVEYLAAESVDRVDILSRLNNTEIVYYIGHSEYDSADPAKSGWILKDTRITCKDFRGLTSPPALVFANSCESCREASQLGSNISSDAARGIASGFILAGVRNYIGSIWPISPESSAAFARDFFENLINGIPIGECLVKARRCLIRDFGPAEIVWASYILYGDPGRTFLSDN